MWEGSRVRGRALADLALILYQMKGMDPDDAPESSLTTTWIAHSGLSFSVPGIVHLVQPSVSDTGGPLGPRTSLQG